MKKIDNIPTKSYIIKLKLKTILPQSFDFCILKLDSILMEFCDNETWRYYNEVIHLKNSQYLHKVLCYRTWWKIISTDFLPSFDELVEGPVDRVERLVREGRNDAERWLVVRARLVLAVHRLGEAGEVRPDLATGRAVVRREQRNVHDWFGVVDAGLSNYPRNANVREAVDPEVRVAHDLLDGLFVVGRFLDARRDRFDFHRILSRRGEHLAGEGCFGRPDLLVVVVVEGVPGRDGGRVNEHDAVDAGGATGHQLHAELASQDAAAEHADWFLLDVRFEREGWGLVKPKDGG